METKKYDLKPRIKDFLAALGMTANRLETICGFSKRYLSNVNFVVPQDKYEKILSVLPQLNRNWLETGEGEMFNNLLRAASLPQNDEASLSMNYRIGIFKRLTAVIEANGFSVDTYEKINRLTKGTIKDTIFNADSPVVKAWIFDIMSDFPDYSIEWVLHDRGIKNIGASNRFPLISVDVALHALNDNEFPDNWLDIASNDDQMVIIPEDLSPNDHHTEKGFLVIVPALNEFYGGGIAKPGDFLLCELTPTHPTDWRNNETYLIYYGGKIWCCKLEEPNGFYIEDRDVFTQDYYFVPKEAAITLGHIIGQVKFTSYWASKELSAFTEKMKRLSSPE